jgi:hypothetical protein
MKTTSRNRSSGSGHLGFLLDELRSAGVITYADLAATFMRTSQRL